MHQCEIFSQGGSARPIGGAFQWTWYGLFGPVIAAITIWFSRIRFERLIWAAVSATVFSAPLPSAEVQLW